MRLLQIIEEEEVEEADVGEEEEIIKVKEEEVNLLDSNIQMMISQN